MPDFPNRLKKLRTDSNLTQKQLAEKLNVSQNAVYNWENGKREPNLDMMKKIAKVFDIALYMLLDDNYELPDITSDAWKKRARFLSDTEMTKCPHFTTSSNSDTKILSEETARYRFEHLTNKLFKGDTLTPEEMTFKTQYLEKEVKKIGTIIAKYYAMLNEDGKKEADKQIDRTIDQMILLTKIPEYRKEEN